MKFRITRQAVRRSYRQCYISKKENPNITQLSRLCLITDMVINVLSETQRHSVVVSTGITGRVLLERFTDGLEHRIDVKDGKGYQIVNVFDGHIWQGTKSADKVYKDLKEAGLLEFELDIESIPADFWPDVRIAYKQVDYMMRSAAVEGDSRFTYKNGVWNFPSIPKSKFFVWDGKQEDHPHLKQFKCLILNSMPAYVRAYASEPENHTKFWEKFTTEKNQKFGRVGYDADYEFGLGVLKNWDNVLYCDAVKLLKEVK